MGTSRAQDDAVVNLLCVKMSSKRALITSGTRKAKTTKRARRVNFKYLRLKLKHQLSSSYEMLLIRRARQLPS